MKKLFISLGLAAIMFAPSCSTDFAENDTLLNGVENGGIVEEGVIEEAAGFITVGIDNTDTRLSVGEEAEGRIPLYWNTGDKLLVNRTIETLAISEEYNGKDVASFGLSEENLAKVTYPITLMYPASVSTNNDKHFYIPTEQAYLQGHLSNGYGILMGKAEKEGDVINLQHMCGYLKVSLTGSTTVKKVMLRTAGHEPLSGFFKHNETATEIGMTSYTAAGLADGYYNSPVISIDSAEGVALSGEATDFYFALPAGVYSKGFVLHVLDSNNKQHRVKAYSTGKTIEAGVMIKMPALPVNCEKDWGIYDGNELVSFGRTLDKNAWLGVGEETIYLRNDIDMQNEDLTDIPEDSNHRALIGFRSGYKNDKIAVFEGKKSDTENYVIYNLRKSTDTDGGLLFARVPDYLTVQNVTLGKTIDDPTTDANEADSYVSLDLNETYYAYTSTFSYVVVGTVKNCINNASVIGKATASNGLKVGTFSGSSDTSIGVIEDCVNNGSIIIDATPAKKKNYVGGIAAINYGTIKNCTNNGTIKITGSAATEGLLMAGITGCTSGSSQTIGCYNYGAISGISSTTEVQIGGIVGQFKSGTSISGCHNHGAVTSTNASGTPYVAGVIGYAYDAVSDCHNHGEVTINSAQVSVRMGGTIGVADKAVTNCSNSGNISLLTPAAGGRMGGVIGDASKSVTNCTNTGNVTLNGAVATTHVGGVLGTNNYVEKDGDTITASQLLTGCVNGSNGTEQGKINITCKSSVNIYAGGICGYSYEIIQGDSTATETFATNYAPISVDGSATTDVGGVWGYVQTKSTLVGYKNCGNVTITNAGSNSYSYCGGVGGNCSKDNKTYNCDNTGNLTIHFSKGKVRAGFIMPYLATASKCDATGTLHIKSGTAAASEVGGLGGFSNNSTKSDCTLNIKIKNEATGVLVGGLLGSANGSKYSNCTIKAEIESSDVANTAFAVSRAAAAGYSVTLGESKKPLKINKASKFNGITASSIDVFSDYQDSGKINFSNSHATLQLTVARTNITFVD